MIKATELKNKKVPESTKEILSIINKLILSSKIQWHFIGGNMNSMRKDVIKELVTLGYTVKDLDKLGNKVEISY